MKTTKTFFNAINTAATAVRDACNSVAGVWQELRLAEGEKNLRYRLAPYGEFPVTLADGRVVMQVVDRAAGEAMRDAFNSLTAKIALFFKGAPIYEGHADDAGWRMQNPGHKPVAVGRIKKIEPGEDGIYVESVFNSRGAAMLGGEAPEYSGHSPHWRLVPIPGEARDRMRPVVLWSDALTNNPNIADNVIALNSLLGIEETQDGETRDARKEFSEEPEKPNDMKLTPEALKALGFAPDAAPTEAEISAAVIKLLGKKDEADAAKATSESAVSAANSRITLLTTELDALRGASVTNAINAAIADGRITEADKGKWTDALNASFDSESAKLAKLMPAINTTSRLPGGMGERREGNPAVGGADAINTALGEIAREKGYNLGKREDYDAAWKILRDTKPELMARG